MKEACFFSVLADEASCHNLEHVPVCPCFVDKEWEEFIDFVNLQMVRAVDIADAIVTIIENIGVSLSGLCGQGYNGVSTMSGAKAGEQARIRQQQPKALYTRCAGHSFNLAIQNSCSIPYVRNCIHQIV